MDVYWAYQDWYVNSLYSSVRVYGTTSDKNLGNPVNARPRRQHQLTKICRVWKREQEPQQGKVDGGQKPQRISSAINKLGTVLKAPTTTRKRGSG